MESTTVKTPDGLSLDVVHHATDDSRLGAVLLAHGITQDMGEGGMFVRLADRLTGAGFEVIRFSFRGHGDSDGNQRGVTIAGERLDFESVVEHVFANYAGPYFVVAKSFGAVSTCLALDRFEGDLAGLVLWNPVLDIAGTFLEPTVSWGQRNFTGERLDALAEHGYLSIDGRFEMGRVLYDELERYDPGARFVASSIPALVIHGDADDIVPYEDVRRIAEDQDADFHTIEGGNHGFVRAGEGLASSEGREQDRRTIVWLTERVKG